MRFNVDHSYYEVYKLGEAYEYAFSVACCVVSKPAAVDNSAKLRTGICTPQVVRKYYLYCLHSSGDESSVLSATYSARFVLFQHDAVFRCSNPAVTQYTFPKDAGAAARENICRAPGPGQYNLPTGVGKQVCCTFNDVLSFPHALTKKNSRIHAIQALPDFPPPRLSR